MICCICKADGDHEHKCDKCGKPLCKRCWLQTNVCNPCWEAGPDDEEEE
jgi:hypothetical protein